MSRDLERLRDAYNRCKKACDAERSGEAASSALKEFVMLALRFLEEKCTTADLISKVKTKEYVAFARKNASSQISRPANKALFRCDANAVIGSWDRWVEGLLPETELARLSYTACLAPCLALELFDRQNKKGPATFFEGMIGHIFARALHCNPHKNAEFDIQGTKARMTMDFLFHLSEHRRIHLAAKMSTRERVVKAWAHQRILDVVHGAGTYAGIMVLFAETKLDSRSREVVEICVPEQWFVYQSLLSRMERIYYFDIPDRYLALAAKHPTLISMKQFAHFFNEIGQVLGN